MDLKRKDLPVLRGAAMSQCPLLPGQVAALREIVTQVYLAGERFSVDPDLPGFMGVRFSPEERIERSDGILVLERIPGFPAYRYLQSGDVIVRLIDWPAVQLHSPDDFINAVKFLDAGDVLRLAILRDGRYMAVSVPLDFRPLDISGPTMTYPSVDAWIVGRQQEAEAYWNSEFSAMEPVSTQASTSDER